MTKEVSKEPSLEGSSQKGRQEITYKVSGNESVLFGIGVIIGMLFFIHWADNILTPQPYVRLKEPDSIAIIMLLIRNLLPISWIVMLLLGQMFVTAHIKSNGIKVSSK